MVDRRNGADMDGLRRPARLWAGLSRQLALRHLARLTLSCPVCGVLARAPSLTGDPRLKILLRIIEKDRRLRNFTDVIGYALGARGEGFVTVLFVIEVCAWVIALIVLFSDSLALVLPQYSSDQWKLLGLVFVIPTTFLPLRYLSFCSGLGILSVWALVFLLLFTGLYNPTAPGSLRDPAPTDLWPSHGPWKLLSVFGLLIAGFGGHGLIPNLIHDMADPHQADTVCESAYAVALAVYALVAGAGYAMYGSNVSDEISRDLARTVGAPPGVGQMAAWMVALNPITKIALGIRPLADMIFTRLGLHKTELLPPGAQTPRYVTRPPSPALEGVENTAVANLIQDVDEEQRREGMGGESAFTVYADAESSFSRIGYDPASSLLPPPRNLAAHTRRERVKALTRHAVRVGLAVLFTAGALAMPSFERVMGLLGSGFASFTLIILPVWAGAAVFGWRWWHVAAIVCSAVAGTLGTIAAFM